MWKVLLRLEYTVCYSLHPELLILRSVGVDLVGKTAIVTGSSSGIGLECARQLLARGLSKLILAVRDEKKGAVAREDLMSGRDLKAGAIEIWHMDYSSYGSIMSFADRAKALEALDIVVLNAGIYRIPRVILPTGHEEDIQVNYLSTAFLTILLLPILEAKRRPGTEPGCLTVVSSSVAAWSRFKLPQDGRPLLTTLDEPMGTAAFDHHQQYCTSKLLGQLFLVELTRRVPSSVATITYVHPGLCYGSGLARDSMGTIAGFIAGIIFRIFGRSCVGGAQAIVDAAVAHGEEAHGHYLVDGKPAKLAPIVYTPEGGQMAQRLWKETMSELSFAGVEDIIEALVS
ncbi:retinol dehydrogenase 12 [Xylaria bambusicola]|uniref:retinol dehydrogenase 12 n=1 Tax=Xylaria bambusicola TaxID=326684 RepID=UPI0020079757|nr:retinol dehydrogenase 12 [Xylaria bambusicola]KAI0526425.1 retinol dehydrogenase 12 [Xylaria bambusicola]